MPRKADMLVFNEKVVPEDKLANPRNNLGPVWHIGPVDRG